MKLDHVGIAVRSLKLALETYKDHLGFELHEIVTIEEQGVKVAVLPCGESCIELLEPTRNDSPIFRFLEKRGEGVHHLCFRVDDIDQKLDAAEINPHKIVKRDSMSRSQGSKNCLFASKINPWCARLSWWKRWNSPKVGF